MALISACVYGHTRIVQFFLENEVDPNLEEGEPLIMTSMNSQIEVVKLLLEYKANPYAQDGKALTTAFSYYMDENKVNPIIRPIPAKSK